MTSPHNHKQNPHPRSLSDSIHISSSENQQQQLKPSSFSSSHLPATHNSFSSSSASRKKTKARKPSSKASKVKVKRAVYAPLANSPGIVEDERFLMGDVSPRPSGSNKDYFTLDGSHSDSDSDRLSTVSSTHSGDRLVHSNSSRSHRSPMNHSPGRPSRTNTSSGSSAPISYAPSLMGGLPDTPLEDGQPLRYHDSLVPLPSDFTNSVPPVTSLSSAQFIDIVDEVRAAIEEGIYPTLISQGSSGSYFCRNRAGEVVGVFKPKNEEPYGHLNPKWTKWIHKNLFPCCFGRSCIIPNLGYVSEAAASFVDRRLDLNVVPRTEVVYLASPTFYYSRKDWKAYQSGKPLPEKIGSFQIFLKGFKDASRFFREGYNRLRRSGSLPTSPRGSNESLPNRGSSPYEWSSTAQKEFQWGFERLVVLDYLIRNTDRGLDNWMVKYDEEKDEEERKRELQQELNVQEPGVSQSDKQDKEVESGDTLAQQENRVDGSKGVDSGSAQKEGDTVSIDGGLAGSMFGSIETVEIVHKESDEQEGSSPSSVVPGMTMDIPEQTCDTTNSSSQVTTDPLTPEIVSTPQRQPIVQVAAIDNGLAFPWKHPDRWRSYPYGWAYLPLARIPFSSETRIQVLHLLTSPTWWKETMDGLEKIFRIDADFSEKMWRKQRAVVRGEGYNLVETLRRSEVDGIGGSPWGLVRRPVVSVFEEEIEDEEEGDLENGRWPEGPFGAPGAPPPRRRSFVERQGIKGRRFVKRVRQRFETFARSRPCFENW